MQIFEMATRLAADFSHEAGTEVGEKEQHMRAFFGVLVTGLPDD